MSLLRNVPELGLLLISPKDGKGYRKNAKLTLLISAFIALPGETFEWMLDFFAAFAVNTMMPVTIPIILYLLNF